MEDTGFLSCESLSAACEEAEALVWYFARHCPREPDEAAKRAYAELVKALSEAHTNSNRESYQSLMTAYQAVANYTFSTEEVHGRSIQNSTRKAKGWREKFADKRFRPVLLGLIFFVSAVVLQLLDAWIQRNLVSVDKVSAEGLWAALLASCVPLLVPAAWGGLGACTALAKRISDRVTAMSYEDNRMQGLSARIFLGAALALILDILVFVEGPGTDGAAPGFGPIAGAFLAGLFVQHIYNALEVMMQRIAVAISPGSEVPRTAPKAALPAQGNSQPGQAV